MGSPFIRVCSIAFALIGAAEQARGHSIQSESDRAFREPDASATLLLNLSKFDRAIPLLEANLRDCEQTARHPVLCLEILLSLNVALNGAEEWERYERNAATAFALASTLVKTHPYRLTAKKAYAAALAQRGQLTLSLKLYRESLSQEEKALGKNHWLVANTHRSIAALYFAQGDLQQSRRSAVKSYEISYKIKHPGQVIVTLFQIAQIDQIEKKYEDAKIKYKSIIYHTTSSASGLSGNFSIDQLPALNIIISTSYINLSTIEENLNNFDRALEYAEHALFHLKRSPREVDNQIIVRTLMADLLRRKGQIDRAHELAKQSIDMQIEAIGRRREFTERYRIKLQNPKAPFRNYIKIAWQASHQTK